MGAEAARDEGGLDREEQPTVRDLNIGEVDLENLDPGQYTIQLRNKRFDITVTSLADGEIAPVSNPESQGKMDITDKKASGIKIGNVDLVDLKPGVKYTLQGRTCEYSLSVRIKEGHVVHATLIRESGRQPACDLDLTSSTSPLAITKRDVFIAISGGARPLSTQLESDWPYGFAFAFDAKTGGFYPSNEGSLFMEYQVREYPQGGQSLDYESRTVKTLMPPLQAPQIDSIRAFFAQSRS